MGKDELQTEDYRLGALGGAAQGYGLKSKAPEVQPAAQSRLADSPRPVVFSLQLI